MPFDEIRALLMTKRDSEWGSYHVILGALTAGRLMETIFFSLQTRIGETFVDEVIERAVSISDRFILKE